MFAHNESVDEHDHPPPVIERAGQQLGEPLRGGGDEPAGHCRLGRALRRRCGRGARRIGRRCPPRVTAPSSLPCRIAVRARSCLPLGPTRQATSVSINSAMTSRPTAVEAASSPSRKWATNAARWPSRRPASCSASPAWAAEISSRRLGTQAPRGVAGVGGGVRVLHRGPPPDLPDLCRACHLARSTRRTPFKSHATGTTSPAQLSDQLGAQRLNSPTPPASDGLCSSRHCLCQGVDHAYPGVTGLRDATHRGPSLAGREGPPASGGRCCAPPGKRNRAATPPRHSRLNTARLLCIAGWWAPWVS